MQDTAMVVNLWSFHNDPNFWVEPEVFRPERFLDEKGHLLKKDYSLLFRAGQWCQFLPLAFLISDATYAKHHSQVHNISVLYLWVPRLKFRSGGWLFWGFHDFLGLSGMLKYNLRH